MPTERRYQVFVSSTYRDLKSERDKILRTLAEFNYIPAGMEYFPAIDEEQLKFIKTIIDDSDYYVVILSGLYGSIAPDGKSYTEKEFDYARSKGLPVCALLREDIETLPPEYQETDPSKRELLNKFRQKLIEGRLVTFWKDENDLSLRIVQSLAVTAKKYPAPGWLRGGPEEPLELLRKIQALESENLKLKEELSELKKAAEITPEALRSFLNSECAIPYSHTEYPHDRAYKAQGMLKTSWAGVAAYLLPKLIAPTGASFLKSSIDYWLFEVRGKTVIIPSDATDTIKLTLTAHDLMANYSAEKVGGGVIEFVAATPLGIRVCTMVKLGQLPVAPATWEEKGAYGFVQGP